VEPEFQILSLLASSHWTWTEEELADFLSGDGFVDKEKWSEFYYIIGDLKESGHLKDYCNDKGKTCITYTIKGLWLLHTEIGLK
jgi:hypothetical protein